jgi:diaminopimelate epimerase
MASVMKINFWKMHGTLNDFIVFDDPDETFDLTPRQIAKLCDRRSGIGADGVIVAKPSAIADFFMDYRNSDGSLAEMCGNGIRCLAKYVYDQGLSGKTNLIIETRAGTKSLKLFPNSDAKIERVSVDMGKPEFDPQLIPVTLQDAGLPVLDYPLNVKGKEFKASFVSMGNPHAVIVLERMDESLPSIYGSQIERHSMFPSGANVEFVEVKNRGRIVMRVWERGSGETMSCGTGACASVVITSLKGLTDPGVTVELPGGALEINWKGLGKSVLMNGPAELVYVGAVTI